jgi:hypothetical protein
MTEGLLGSKKKRFRLRVFVSFSLLLSSAAMAVAGIALYFRPEGTLSAWTGWSFLGLDKKGWEGIHTILIAAVLIFGVLHVIYNWKALSAYLRKKTASGARSKIEFATALILMTAILTAAIVRWPPVWKIMDIRGAIKQGSLSVRVPPPFPDAADRSLSELCPAVSIDPNEALARLKQAGYPAEDISTNLTRMAKKFGLSPERLFRIMTGR